MERKRRQKRYRRLDRAERAAIQNGLERGWSCRRMARELGRSPSTVADEVARNVYCQALADKIGVMISTLSAFCVPTAFPTSEICQA